ncbi:hypothetical protein [Pengzhenrongella sicca]|uniref:DUF559 domain-containing protein n=1 Tax=Pengzhenrongella sicca TaxID=2819238 RepID=A0A8A4ZAH2_9MICO|nr:hypothetical protein [Pengzhenrongella sicca]QTE28922.1 hypothetical protein J4E96_16595 [Pengzhenrongella sicca]
MTVARSGMSVVARLTELNGCGRRAQVAHGASEVTELGALLASGAVVRPARGVYALAGARAEVVVARRACALLTCASAASVMALPLLEQPAAVHLARPGHGSTPRPGVLPSGAVLHWDSGLSRTSSSGRSVLVSGSRALAHALGCLPAREAIALVDAAVNRGLVSVGDVAAHRPRAGKVGFDRLLRAVDGRSQSMPESFARLALQESGVHVEPQVWIAGVGHVDLLVEDLVAVELDGFAYHGDRRQFREDRRRDRILALTGVPVLRFAFEDTVFDTARLVTEVNALVRALRRAGRRPLDGSLRRGARDS